MTALKIKLEITHPLKSWPKSWSKSCKIFTILYGENLGCTLHRLVHVMTWTSSHVQILLSIITAFTTSLSNIILAVCLYPDSLIKVWHCPLRELLVSVDWTLYQDLTAQMRIFAVRICLKHLFCPHAAYLYETQRQKTYLQKCALSDDSDQTAHSRSLIRIFTERFLNRQGCKVSSCRQRRRLSGCSYAQADLSLRWAHMP